MRFDDFRLFEDEWSQPPLEEPSPPPVVQVPPPVVAQAALPAFSGMIRDRDPTERQPMGYEPPGAVSLWIEGQ